MKASGLMVDTFLATACTPPRESVGHDNKAAPQIVPSVASRSSDGASPLLDGATAWLQTEPLASADFRGKVVLIDFWTYSCINWRRTLPHVRAWAETYKDRGLVVVGVHSPEFSFERNVDDVRRAAKDMRVGYPIAVDNDFAIWRAFQNEAWPALYLIDRRGHVRYRHFGEGDYESQERLLQQLLAEDQGAVAHDLAPVEASGLEVDADWSDLDSPETYVGYERTERFASPGGIARDERRLYGPPAELRRNEWALSGEWTIGHESTVLYKSNGRVAFKFHARDLHLVMGPTERGATLRFRVLLDGRPPGSAHGTDVDERGNGVATEKRLVQLIRQTKPIADHVFEIEFFDGGAEIDSFTFG